MSEPTSIQCELCDQFFSSSRARTQHRRFVHDGAALFGYCLNGNPGRPGSPGEGDTPQSAKSEEYAADEDPIGDENESSLGWALFVAGLAVGALLFLRLRPTESTRNAPSVQPGFSPYGATRSPAQGGSP